MIYLPDEIKKDLKNGEDYSARDVLCGMLLNIIERSNKGEIAIADFLRELNKVSKLGEKWKKRFIKYNW